MFFFFNDTATTEIYTLSLHDALPISSPAAARKHVPARAIRRIRPHRGALERSRSGVRFGNAVDAPAARLARGARRRGLRSEEHTSELQSRQYLVCRLLLEKKKNTLR